MPRRLDRFFRRAPGRTHQVLPALHYANQLMAAEDYQAGAAAFDKVEWIDDLTVEYPFCDSPVRAGQ